MAVIGAMLLGKAGSRARPAPGWGRLNRATKDLTTLRMSLDAFQVTCGRYPTTEEGLEALVINSGVEGWDGPYVNKVRPDPWRTRYIYSCEREAVTLFSSGPDRVSGTADDIFPEPESFTLDSAIDDPGKQQE